MDCHKRAYDDDDDDDKSNTDNLHTAIQVLHTTSDDNDNNDDDDHQRSSPPRFSGLELERGWIQRHHNNDVDDDGNRNPVDVGERGPAHFDF